MSDFIIETKNLVKRFGRTLSLNDLNLKVPKGISGFVGKNGAGKTTTISVLLGLLKPNSGEANVFGLDCWRNSFEVRRKVGVMHEISAFPGNFTGIQFLEYVASIYEIPQSKQRSNEMMKTVGLSNVKDKPIKAYSAGMFRRIGLAQALICDPELAILDEPTANIDPLGRITLLEEIRELNKRYGTSFLMSTHILSDLEKICNWLTIIDSGHVVEQGDVRVLAKKYSANVLKIDVSNPQLLKNKLRELCIVEDVWINDEKVICRVNDLTVFYETLPRIVSELKLQLRSLQNLIGTIEEIYKSTYRGEL